MVALSSRFALLAALSSIAALTTAPVYTEAAAIQPQYRDALDYPIVARHSSHPDAKADVSHGHRGSSKSQMKVAAKDASTNKTADKQRHPKPVVPLPARLAQKNSHKGSGSTAENSASKESHREATGSKHAKSARSVSGTADPIQRMQRLWLGARGVTVQDVPRGASTHHFDARHHHGHDHHDHTKVIVQGDGDHVKVHERSVSEDARHHALRDDRDHVIIEGHNDHVHVHDHHESDPGRVVVKGDNDHVHVHRSPSPHHRHYGDKVVVKGDHDSVHFHRSPSPHHHHDGHHDTVVVKGDDDHVSVHRRSPTPHRHHRHKVIVKGDNQHVHVGRSPLPAPLPHHHHHHSEKVIVKGSHDHVNVHDRRSANFGSHSVSINSGNGRTYYIPYHQVASQADPSDGLLDMKLHLRRGEQSSGVPGSIDIMSPVANSTTGERLASLVLAAPSNSTAGENATSSTFVLNASDSGRTQMYLVTSPDADDGSSSSNSTTSNSTNPASFIRVTLQMPVFDAASAELRPYCATFDPRPAAPAPMTVEACMQGSSNDAHKSQVFTYEPETGVIHPTWFSREDDGTGDDTALDSPEDDVDSDDDATPDDPTDDDGSDDSGDNISGPQGNSTTVDPATPASDKIASVTSFEDEALDQRYGDATRPPARVALPKRFPADALSSARNVTLVFTPAAPEVSPSPVQAPAEKIAVPATDSDSTSSTVTSTSSASSSSSLTTNTDAAATTMAALDATTTSATVTSSDSAATSPASGSNLSETDSLATASATSSPALEVKVYNPYAEDVTSDSASSSVTTSSGSSAAATMTPVSTAPYEWMFKQGAVTDLE
ncbi:hypothetical protein GY45DRAFT_437625 [Cubamyces sp. BRFM 1775]|nr:hypothetical protein GY45DRAFT_437625 [Cubamyces sp. BRFM 1775]